MKAETYKAFLEHCQTWAEFNELLDLALSECFAADLHMAAATGRVWLAFQDGSDCYVETPKGE